MGLAKLTKVTVISPRSEYSEVAKALAKFEHFHPVQDGTPNFDPTLQELAVKAVRLFAQADQTVKDLGLQLLPGTIDVVFRGVKVPRNDFEASTWDELLTKAEVDLNPIVEEVRAQRAVLQRAMKAEADAQVMMEALRAVSGFSADLSRLGGLSRLKVTLAVVGKESIDEFRNSVPGAIFIAHELSEARSLVLVVTEKSEEGKVDKAMKALEIKPLVIPPGLPQNPAQAFRQLSENHEAAEREKEEVEARLEEIKERSGTSLLAIRELTEVAREMLDEVRVSGGLSRMATVSGYIPAKQEARFKELCGSWIVHTEPAVGDEHGHGVPTLLENPSGLRTFQLITGQQGTPGSHEVDPTPIISFVFPIFFGIMFADFGDGIIFSLVSYLIRRRGTGSLRQWGNIFLTAGITSTIFGAVFGEFFGFQLYRFIPIPPLIEVMDTAFEQIPVPNIGHVLVIMEVSILIGIAHLTTGMSLDLYQSLKERNIVEALVEKLPNLTMYVSGVAYGVAFIVAGYNFNVLKSAAPVPFLGIPNDVLGGVAMAVLFPSMIVLFCGKAVAAKMGKMEGVTVGGALANGGLEVFERISLFLSNTISYVRLAILLLVHAVLVQTISYLSPLTNPVFIPTWIIFNILIILFEGLVVYIQDLRLHIYEFFTKFYRGTGTPFRKILPERVRIDIKWR